jgi:hypothetical protein
VAPAADMFLYLLPSMALAVLLRVLAAVHPLFFVFTVAGTACHELAHFLVGLLVGARPSSLSLWPRRAGRHWQLGSVTLTRVRWWNAAPAALAPLLIVLLPLGVAWWRTAPGWRFAPLDLALAFLLAPQFLSFWPSPADWKIAFRSWPMVVILVAGIWIVFRFVKPWLAAQ